MKNYCMLFSAEGETAASHSPTCTGIDAAMNGAADHCAKALGWRVGKCVSCCVMRSVDAISAEILTVLAK